MAYADYTFYEGFWYGNVVPEDDFPRLAERASDFLDTATGGRLRGITNEWALKRIGKAACAVAEKLYLLELAEAAAVAAASSAASIANGTATGAVASQSAGAESVSYASLSQTADGARDWSAALSAAGNPGATNRLLYDAAKLYLGGVKDSHGLPVLYAGMR
ncbi:MAG: hypothetical protein LUC30_10305 [Clostridiales bacterium]|nr:hypothetical protein [Clostridiales bacterium]